MQTEVKARFITDELVNKSFLLRSVNERIIERELIILDELRAPILEVVGEIRRFSEDIAALDLNSTLGHLAQRYHFTRPQLVHSPGKPVLHIENGRHPILDCKFQDSQPPLHFTSNSLHLHADSRFVLLTGPNMGGKSTFLRQCALIALMAQCGSFVPADACTLSPVDAIFTRIGASDDLCKDQSTFMMEMQETAHILKNLTADSLLVIDEIGRGTSAREGSALATAIAQHLSTGPDRPRTLFATHYHEIADHLPNDDSIQSLCSQASFDSQTGQILLQPRLIPGVQRHSYALPVASLAGLPASVISTAERLLNPT